MKPRKKTRNKIHFDYVEDPDPERFTLIKNNKKLLDIAYELKYYSYLIKKLIPHGRFFKPPLQYIIAVFLIISACSDDDPGSNSQLNASAGNDMNVLSGAQVNLDGSGSSDSEGNPFEFLWEFISKPATSTAILNNSDQAMASFTADKQGKYKIKLTISNTGKNSDTVTVAAFSVQNINGVYTNMTPGPDVGIRDFVTALGCLIATCEFSEIGGIEAAKIACYDGNGWKPLGCGLEEGSIYDMIEYKGELYVTGDFTEIGCIQANRIARWDGLNWRNVENGLTGGDNVFGHALSVYDNELYVGGQFEKAGDVDAQNIAKWDGAEWHNVGTIEEGSVRVLEVYKQKLYAGGFFTMVNGNSIERIAAYDGSSWAGLGPLNDLELKSTGIVRNMAVLKDVLYISGDFTSNGSDVSELITWNGNRLQDFGRAFSMYVGNEIDELTVVNDILYIGGSFRNVVASQAGNILQWDGEQWGIMSTGINGHILSVESFNGQIFIGGEFGMAGGTNAENISIWTRN